MKIHCDIILLHIQKKKKIPPIPVPTAATNVSLSAMWILAHIKLGFVFICKIINHKSAQMQLTYF
jgi:hypothetical protein